MTNEMLPHFRSNRSGGLIINVSSLATFIGLPFQDHYSASKFAMEGYIEAIGMKLKPFNIRTCNINTADFKTEFTENRKIYSIFRNV